MIYTYFSDAAHGWIRVHKSQLDLFNVTPMISKYSYMDANFVYLEEDCDANKFFEHLEKKGIEFTFEEIYHEKSPIRLKQRFSIENF